MFTPLVIIALGFVFFGILVRYYFKTNVPLPGSSCSGGVCSIDNNSCKSGNCSVEEKVERESKPGRKS